MFYSRFFDLMFVSARSPQLIWYKRNRTTREIGKYFYNLPDDVFFEKHFWPSLRYDMEVTP